MADSMILGLAGSNRSGLTRTDEQRLTDGVLREYVEDDFNIYGTGTDKISRAVELIEQLAQGLDTPSLTNSETALIVALISARMVGTEVELLSLNNVLKEGKAGLERLKDALSRCAGIVSSSPVYFGDRSSFVHDLLNMIHHDPELMALFRDKVFCGISIGAKRNGGQETMLIYQLLDFLEMGVLGVGNDAFSTSQYGGTCMAGDVGTLLHDAYGVLTSQGTGRRGAAMARFVDRSSGFSLKDKLKVGFFLLQDSNGKGEAQLTALLERFSGRLDPKVFRVAYEPVIPCKGCKLCPAFIGPIGEYRCAVRDPDDFFMRHHTALLDLDVLVPVLYSPRDKRGLRSAYQRFVERTRYIRRSDYIFSDIPFTAMIFEEPGANQNLHIRVLTSLIRHQTVALRPMIVHIWQDTLLSSADMDNAFEMFLAQAELVTVARHASTVEGQSMSLYNPVGFTLNYARDKHAAILEERRNDIMLRHRKLRQAFHDRIIGL